VRKTAKGNSILPRRGGGDAKLKSKGETTEGGNLSERGGVQAGIFYRHQKKLAMKKEQKTAPWGTQISITLPISGRGPTRHLRGGG